MTRSNGSAVFACLKLDEPRQVPSWITRNVISGGEGVEVEPVEVPSMVAPVEHLLAILPRLDENLPPPMVDDEDSRDDMSGVLASSSNPTARELELAQENEALRQLLSASLQALGVARRQLLESAEAEVAKVACAISERVIGEELAQRPELMLAWIREAVASLEDDDVVVACSPDFARRLGDGETTLAGRPLVIDESLPSDTCEVRGTAASIRTDARARLDSVIEQLCEGS